MSDSECYSCGAKDHLKELYGYQICSHCLGDLRLLKEETVRGHIGEQYKDKKSYKQEIERRLEIIEKEFKDKKIKLMNVRDILENS